MPSRALSMTILAALLVLAPMVDAGCQFPGPRSAEVTADRPSDLLRRCADAARGMHFDVEAVDRSHLIVVAEGKVEGDLAFHQVRLSIKVVHLERTRYRVEAIATSDERGIRAGAEKKARQFFFQELEERGGLSR